MSDDALQQARELPNILAVLGRVLSDCLPGPDVAETLSTTGYQQWLAVWEQAEADGGAAGRYGRRPCGEPRLRPVRDVWHLARQSRRPGQESGTERRSGEVLFAYLRHVPAVPRALALPPVDDPAASTTRDEVVLQRLLSHLLPLVPGTPPPTGG